MVVEKKKSSFRRDSIYMLWFLFDTAVTWIGYVHSQIVKVNEHFGLLDLPLLYKYIFILCAVYIIGSFSKILLFVCVCFVSKGKEQVNKRAFHADFRRMVAEADLNSLKWVKEFVESLTFPRSDNVSIGSLQCLLLELLNNALLD